MRHTQAYSFFKITVIASFVFISASSAADTPRKKRAVMPVDLRTGGLVGNGHVEMARFPRSAQPRPYQQPAPPELNASLDATESLEEHREAMARYIALTASEEGLLSIIEDERGDAGVALQQSRAKLRSRLKQHQNAAWTEGSEVARTAAYRFADDKEFDFEQYSEKVQHNLNRAKSCSDKGCFNMTADLMIQGLDNQTKLIVKQLIQDSLHKSTESNVPGGAENALPLAAGISANAERLKEIIRGSKHDNRQNENLNPLLRAGSGGSAVVGFGHSGTP